VVLALFVLVLAAMPGRAAADPSLSAETPVKGATAARAKPRKARRGGLNPCMTPDPGWGVYDKWSRNISMGQLLAPQRGGLTKSGGFDLIVHFHGHYPVRKEFVKTAKGIVLAAIDLGVSSGPYNSAFASPQVFEKLIASVEKEMARRSGRKKAHVRKLGLSSWSAGYGAVGQILGQSAGRKVDSVILLDSVHAGYADRKAKTLKTGQLDPFIAFARKAARGQKLMFQSHSSIIPPGYASTREVSNYMVERLGGKMRKGRRSDVLGLTMFERFDKRGYHVRGYRGNDKPDHCAHLGLMKDVIKVHVNGRWRSPTGRKGKRAIAKGKAKAARAGNLYEIKRGDTLSGIAKRHGVKTSELRQANGLSKGGRPIRAGEDLIIPKGAKGTKKAPTKPAGDKPGRGEKVHVVAKGQALIPIARRYKVTLPELRKRNGLTRGRPIRIGQRLIIPRPSKK
jgi:LysM repeat protein